MIYICCGRSFILFVWTIRDVDFAGGFECSVSYCVLLGVGDALNVWYAMATCGILRVSWGYLRFCFARDFMNCSCFTMPNS
jgi:hypothetical protein